MWRKKIYFAVFVILATSAFSIPIEGDLDAANMTTVKPTKSQMTSDAMTTKTAAMSTENTKPKAMTTMSDLTTSGKNTNMTTVSNTTASHLTTESSNKTTHHMMTTETTHNITVSKMTTEKFNMTTVTTAKHNITKPADVTTAGSVTSHKTTLKTTTKPTTNSTRTTNSHPTTTTHSHPTTTKPKFQGGTFAGGIFLGIGLTLIIIGIVYYLKFHNRNYSKDEVLYKST